MGILGSIKDKLFGKKEAPPPVTAPLSTAAEKLKAATQAAVEAQEEVDIEKLMDDAVAAKGIKLNWRTSIVDLMKALDLDSSLAARKELAADLNYKGPHADGSAEKNIWLHKELMKVLAENGGKIPKELLS